MKNQKGITLVALIISIIILLILAGISINALISEDGVISKAEYAVKLQEQNLIYEKVLAGTVFKEDKIDIIKTMENAQKNLIEYTVESKVDDYGLRMFNVRGKNEIYTFTVTEDEISIGTQIGKVDWLDVGDYIWYNEDYWVVFYNDKEYGMQICPYDFSGNKYKIKLNGLNDFLNQKKIFLSESEKYINRAEGAFLSRTIGDYRFDNKSVEQICKIELRRPNEPLQVLGEYPGPTEDMDGYIPGEKEENIKIAVPKLSSDSQNIRLWICGGRVRGTTTTNNISNRTKYGLQTVIPIEGYSKDFTFYELMTFNSTEYEYENNEQTFNFVPFILMDRRIKKVSGDGKTLETAYTFTFNN